MRCIYASESRFPSDRLHFLSSTVRSNISALVRDKSKPNWIITIFLNDADVLGQIFQTIDQTLSRMTLYYAH